MTNQKLQNIRRGIFQKMEEMHGNVSLDFFKLNFVINRKINMFE